MPQAGAYKSGAPLSSKARIFQRGGRRTRPVRTSNTLGQPELERLLAVIRLAPEIGLPLNRLVTIHWERAGIAPGPAIAAATARLLKYARDWLRGHRQPFAYVWVRENDCGDGTKGDHVHILCHVPDGMTFGRNQMRWLRLIAGAPYRARVIDTRRVGGHANTATASPDHYQANLEAVADYVLKGAERDAAEVLGLGRWGDGGRIMGRRSGISRNLSAAVQNSKLA